MPREIVEGLAPFMSLFPRDKPPPRMFPSSARRTAKSHESDQHRKSVFPVRSAATGSWQTALCRTGTHRPLPQAGSMPSTPDRVRGEPECNRNIELPLRMAMTKVSSVRRDSHLGVAGTRVGVGGASIEAELALTMSIATFEICNQRSAN